MDSAPAPKRRKTLPKKLRTTLDKLYDTAHTTEYDGESIVGEIHLDGAFETDQDVCADKRMVYLSNRADNDGYCRPRIVLLANEDGEPIGARVTFRLPS